MFVGGYGRSGSTIIDLLLNRMPGVVAAGEFRHLFGRALGDNELCSCSHPFQDCPFWNAVLSEAFPGGYDRERIQRAVTRFNRVVMVPYVRFPALMTKSMREDARVYADAFTAAYAAVAKVSGARVVIDSTKYPVHGWFLASMPTLTLRVLLLVRDPRAVAHSWQRHRLRPEVHWEKREMPRYTVARSSFAWNLSSSLTAQLRRQTNNYRVQRYEDFVANPPQELASIASFALDAPCVAPTDLFTTQPHVPHTIAGNPVRIGSEHVRVKDDDEWQSMPAYKKFVVVTICALGMHRYRYPLRLKK